MNILRAIEINNRIVEFTENFYQVNVIFNKNRSESHLGEKVAKALKRELTYINKELEYFYNSLLNELEEIEIEKTINYIDEIVLGDIEFILDRHGFYGYSDEGYPSDGYLEDCSEFQYIDIELMKKINEMLVF